MMGAFRESRKRLQKAAQWLLNRQNPNLFHQHAAVGTGNVRKCLLIMELGKRVWAIAEGYIPGTSVDPHDPALVSHEAVCLLNASGDNASIEITVFFEDRQPAGPYQVDLPARRTKHLRFNDLKLPEIIPRDTAYASLIKSDVPIIVQHSRLDSRHPNIALLSTIAFALD